MTNKRQIKKYIRRVGSEIAEVVLPAAVYTKAITDENAIDILDKLSRLEAQAISRLAIAYDKKPQAFESVAAYNAAKSKYFRTAYSQALSEYENGVQELLATINSAKK